MSGSYSVSDVSSHSSASSAWLIVNNSVFDVTSFLDSHPGGKKILLNVAGKDATKQFNSFHKPQTLDKYQHLKIGNIKGAGQAAAAAVKKDSSSSAALVSSSSSGVLVPSSFGSITPFSEPSWYQEFHSPYYNSSHVKFRSALREFVQRELAGNVHEWDEQKSLPKEIYKKAAEAGFLAGVVGSWPTRYAGSKLAGGISPEEFDYFHEFIIHDEVSQCGSGGLVWGLFIGLCIGMPPIMHFGSEYLREKVCKPCFAGEKIICLAITEPDAGSDVAGLKTSAVKSADGKHYIVNGQKKWITNGVFADYFTTAVRTGGPGSNGISLLLIERGPGVKTTQMKCAGVWSSGTTYITFEDVLVPVENLIGTEGEGFKAIVYNFNHERWALTLQAHRFSRVCVEESFNYAMKRKTFGKFLIDHPVIRLKLAHMARQIEVNHAQLENITYQMNRMNYNDGVRVLGGPIALIKLQVTQTFEFCAREAAQIFGGLAYTRGGQGEKVERLYREVRAYAIPGGSEEIMADLAIKQALKNYQKKANQTDSKL